MRSLSQVNIRKKTNNNEVKILDILANTKFTFKKVLPILSKYKIKGINDKIQLPKIKKMNIEKSLNIKSPFLKTKIRNIPEINLDSIYIPEKKLTAKKMKKNFSDFALSNSTISTSPLSNRPLFLKKKILGNKNTNSLQTNDFLKKFKSRYEIQQYFFKKFMERDNVKVKLVLNSVKDTEFLINKEFQKLKSKINNEVFTEKEI
jgi:hypothetical protein